MRTHTCVTVVVTFTFKHERRTKVLNHTSIAKLKVWFWSIEILNVFIVENKIHLTWNLIQTYKKSHSLSMISVLETLFQQQQHRAHSKFSAYLQCRFPAEWCPSDSWLCPPPQSRWAGALPATQTAPSWVTDCSGQRAPRARNRSAPFRHDGNVTVLCVLHTIESSVLMMKSTTLCCFRVWRWMDSATRWMDSISSQSTRCEFWQSTATDPVLPQTPPASSPTQMVSFTMLACTLCTQTHACSLMSTATTIVYYFI